MRGSLDIERYEGLVFKTTQMFAEQVKLEPEDMRQELRITVLKAVRTYSAKRSKTESGEEGYVFGCVTNRVKDLKRDAARRAKDGRMVVVHIEDQQKHGDFNFQDSFEFAYLSASHEQVFGGVEGPFALPENVTEEERRVAVQMAIGYTRIEIADELGINYSMVLKLVADLREKCAAWRPAAAPEAVAA